MKHCTLYICIIIFGDLWNSHLLFQTSFISLLGDANKIKFPFYQQYTYLQTGTDNKGNNKTSVFSQKSSILEPEIEDHFETNIAKKYTKQYNSSVITLRVPISLSRNNKQRHYQIIVF